MRNWEKFIQCKISSPSTRQSCSCLIEGFLIFSLKCLCIIYSSDLLWLSLMHSKGSFVMRKQHQKLNLMIFEV